MKKSTLYFGYCVSLLNWTFSFLDQSQQMLQYFIQVFSLGVHQINVQIQKNAILKGVNTNTHMWVGGIQIRMLHTIQLPLTELCSQIVQKTIPM